MVQYWREGGVSVEFGRWWKREESLATKHPAGTQPHWFPALLSIDNLERTRLHG